jgi:hypothetical protein
MFGNVLDRNYSMSVGSSERGRLWWCRVGVRRVDFGVRRIGHLPTPLPACA